MYLIDYIAYGPQFLHKVWNYPKSAKTCIRINNLTSFIYSTRQQKIAIALLRWGCQGPGLARDCALRTRAKSNDYAEIADCASIRNEWVTRDCALRLGSVPWS